ncbi:MAG: family 78 glycoside hydrolase catalytic domain [Clostridia bacterium]|nr:family 78 glycoside hydrolase catalytic domain [Clostridia bacterium]
MMKRVYDLRCRGESAALGIFDNAYFTWRTEGIARQESFRLRVFDPAGNVISERSEKSPYGICYASLPELIPFTRYYFTVETDDGDAVTVSEKGFFISGKKDVFDGAKWISDGRHFVAEGKALDSPAVYFLKKFFVDRVPDTAVISVCGLGFYELYINGKKIGDRVLEPAFTEYDKRILYSSYEVSPMLKEGENVIEAIVGDGWYNQTTTDTWGFYRAPWRDCPKMIFRLDAGNLTLVSDESWQCSRGEIYADAVRSGEYTDFNAERKYFACSVSTPPGGMPEPSFLPPIRECEVVLPVAVKRYEGKVVYDFGKNMSGYVSAIFCGKKGTKVSVCYSDRLTGNGDADNESNSMYISDEGLLYQTDVCILSGGKDDYKPKFTYHGFRYAVIRGDAFADEVKAYFVHTDLKRKLYFGSSSAALNDLYNMSIRSILSNYHGFPTDCPHREKNGWTGDAQLSLETCVYNFDMREAYLKWLGDFAVAQRPSGQIPAIVPTCGWGYNWGSGPAWDIAFFRVTQALYDHYGDKESAVKFYPRLLEYFDYISSYEKDGLVCVGLGDWNYPKNIDFAVCPTELTDSGYYKMMAEILAEISDIAGDGKGAFFREKADFIKSAILKKHGGEKSLTGLAALSYFGTADRTEEVVNYLEKHDYAVHAGILGVKFILDTLGKSGRTDAGYKMLARKNYPSFGYWIENGQTTLCEDFELTNSLNHHMFSPVAEFIIKYICGVTAQPDGDVFIKPNLPQGVENVDVSLETFKGKYRINIYRKNGKVAFFADYPQGGKVFAEGATEAEVIDRGNI